MFIKQQIVGLLGGSFDSPHAGHYRISHEAKKRLGCHKIWWVIAKQNPEKIGVTKASFEQRKAMIEKHTRNFDSKIIDIEKRMKDSCTYNVICLLKRRFPKIQFIWIMGSDNLRNFHHWHRWKDLCELIPIMIFERKPNIYQELKSPFVHCLRNNYLINPKLLVRRSNGWSLIRDRCIPISSTELRRLTS